MLTICGTIGLVLPEKSVAFHEIVVSPSGNVAVKESSSRISKDPDALLVKVGRGSATSNKSGGKISSSTSVVPTSTSMAILSKTRMSGGIVS